MSKQTLKQIVKGRLNIYRLKINHETFFRDFIHAERNVRFQNLRSFPITHGK